MLGGECECGGDPLACNAECCPDNHENGEYCLKDTLIRLARALRTADGIDAEEIYKELKEVNDG